MQRQRIFSSSIRSVGYDPDNQILEIELRSGGVYQYFAVSADKYDGFINAASKGRYFVEHIRNLHRFRKIK